MAFVSLKGGMWAPMPPTASAATPVLASLALTATGNYAAFVFRVPKTGTLDKFEWRAGTITTFPTSGLRCTFEDVDLATGNPDGTVDQFRDITVNPGSNVWVAPGLMTSDGTDTGTKRSVTAGNLLAAVVREVNTAETWTINVSSGSAHTRAEPLVYNQECYAVSSGTKVGYPVMALKYSDGSYEPLAGAGGLPVLTWTTRTFNNASSPDERALFFRFPVPVRVNGVWVAIDLDGDCDLVLYGTDGTSVLATVNLDASVRIGTGPRVIFASFAEQTLLAATDYRLAVKPTTATSVITYDYDVSSNALLDAAGGGKDWYLSTRVDAGSWTQTSTTRPLMGLCVSAVDDGAGGGSTTLIAPRHYIVGADPLLIS